MVATTRAYHGDEALVKRTYLDEVTDRIIADVLHGDSSEATEVAEPPKLGAGAVNVEE